MSPLWQVLLGATLAIAGGFIERLHKDCRTRKGLRLALAAEIRAILETFRESELIEGIEKAVSEMEKHHRPMTIFADFKNEYNLVFTGNAAALGLLPHELLSDLVTFYYQTQIALENLSVLDKARLDLNNSAFNTLETNIEYQRKTLARLKAVLKNGPNLVDKLEKNFWTSNGYG
jgi:hypothetical protein